jgi:hypothetical protein
MSHPSSSVMPPASQATSQWMAKGMPEESHAHQTGLLDRSKQCAEVPLRLSLSTANPLAAWPPARSLTATLQRQDTGGLAGKTPEGLRPSAPSGGKRHGASRPVGSGTAQAVRWKEGFQRQDTGGLAPFRSVRWEAARRKPSGGKRHGASRPVSVTQNAARPPSPTVTYRSCRRRRNGRPLRPWR